MEVMFIFISMKIPAFSHHLCFCGWITFHTATQEKKKWLFISFLLLFQSCRRKHDNGAGDKLVGTMQDCSIVSVRRTAASHLAQRCPQTDLIFPSVGVSMYTVCCWGRSFNLWGKKQLFPTFSYWTALALKLVCKDGWMDWLTSPSYILWPKHWIYILLLPLLLFTAKVVLFKIMNLIHSFIGVDLFDEWSKACKNFV